jgi:RND family efflux transporter MFP subunit
MMQHTSAPPVRLGAPRPAAAFAIFLLAALAGCRHPAVESVATDEDVPVAVQVASVADTFESTLSASGVVTPASGADVTVNAPDAARIAELPKAEGDHVTKGDLLVRFDIPASVADLAAKEADVAQANARVNAAKAARTRTADLVQRGVSAQKDLEAADMEQAQAVAAVKQAEAAVAAANRIVERATVTAPFSGVVAKRWHGVGELVDAGGNVIRLIDPSRLEVVASVTVGDLARVVAGHAAHIGSPASDVSEPGTVVSTPAAVDPASSTAEVRVKFNGPTHLAVGTPVSVAIVAEHLTKVLTIPSVAVVRDGAEVFVMVAGQDDDKAHKTPVVLGLTAGDRVQVKSGLNAGDQVIVRGQDGLPDEAGITVVK